jgi:ketosteroid isomerase-like protein
MTNLRYGAAILGFACILAVGCAKAPSRRPAQDKKEIQTVIGNSITWAMNKNVDLLFGSVAQDSAFFIFHPDSASTIVGFDQFKKMVNDVFMQDAFKATGSSIRDLRINLSRDGDVAWYSAMLDDFGEYNGKPYAWRNTRWTGVLEKRDGTWVIVQMHFSFAN